MADLSDNKNLASLSHGGKVEYRHILLNLGRPLTARGPIWVMLFGHIHLSPICELLVTGRVCLGPLLAGAGPWARDGLTG